MVSSTWTNWLEDRLEPFDRVVQLRATRALMTAFLKVYLDGDERYRRWLTDPAVAVNLAVAMEHK